MSLLILSILFQALQIGSKPFIDPVNYRMSLFNELCTSIYLYITILLTEFMGETGLRDQFGWGLLILVGGVVGINFIRIIANFPSFVWQIYHKIKLKFRKEDDVVKMLPM